MVVIVPFAGTVVSEGSAIVRLPRALVADCLAYDRCVKTDEPAVDKVSLPWPSSRMARRLAPSVVALTFGRPLSAILLSTPTPQGEVSAVLWWSTGQPTQTAQVPVGPTVTAALRRLRVAARAWVVSAVAALMLTGSIALAGVPLAAYLVYRRYILRRYWIRCRLRDREELELRDVSDGFRHHVDSILHPPGTGS